MLPCLYNGDGRCSRSFTDCRVYAVENAQDRLKLYGTIRTDTGKLMPHAVLKFKSTERDEPPEPLAGLWPIKLSAWST
jgi:hypothetical protein